MRRALLFLGGDKRASLPSESLSQLLRATKADWGASSQEPRLDLRLLCQGFVVLLINFSLMKLFRIVEVLMLIVDRQYVETWFVTLVSDCSCPRQFCRSVKQGLVRYAKACSAHIHINAVWGYGADGKLHMHLVFSFPVGASASCEKLLRSSLKGMSVRSVKPYAPRLRARLGQYLYCKADEKLGHHDHYPVSVPGWSELDRVVVCGVCPNPKRCQERRRVANWKARSAA